MAYDARPNAEALATLLGAAAARPEREDFFHLLRRIEAATPERPRLGESARPAEDAVRIGQDPSLGFAPRPVARVALPPAASGLEEEAGPAQLQTFFFGLFGPNGPLPTYLTEHAHERSHNYHDEAFARFADVLHHRMASLFFRAWAEGAPIVSHDRPGEDRFGRQLGSLAGYGMDSLVGRDAMPDLLKLHFVGRLADFTRNPEGLVAILATYFEAEVGIREFVPTRVPLPRSAWTALGGGGATAALGLTAAVGTTVRVHDHRFRIVIGPLDLDAYERFLPGGPALARLAPIVRNYVGEALDWDVNLALRAEAVPKTRLGQASRLGWTSWIGDRRSSAPAADLTVSRHAGKSGTAPADPQNAHPAAS